MICDYDQSFAHFDWITREHRDPIETSLFLYWIYLKYVFSNTFLWHNFNYFLKIPIPFFFSFLFVHYFLSPLFFFSVFLIIFLILFSELISFLKNKIVILCICTIKIWICFLGPPLVVAPLPTKYKQGPGARDYEDPRGEMEDPYARVLYGQDRVRNQRFQNSHSASRLQSHQGQIFVIN